VAAGIGVAVPETAVHENHGVKARKNKVRRAREVFSMKTKTKTHFMDHPSNEKFRDRVLAANPSHPFAALNR
jgi:hypothetical protein